jgi:hypothetical protein
MMDEENIKQSVTDVAEELVDEVNEENSSVGVASVIDDKVESLKSIGDSINPPRNEYQIPDPWEGSYTKGKPQAGLKKTKKRGRPKGSKNKKSKKPTAKTTPPTESPEDKKARVNKMFGGRIIKTAKNFGKTLLGANSPGSPGTVGGGKYGGGSTPSSASGGSLFGIGNWLKEKVITAFQDAKAEKARALEAQSNGAEIPAEMLEPGYFLKKSIGYQFGGRAFDTTFGAFIEKIPSKQSSKKAGFGDQFDYGESDPKKKKNKKDTAGELAAGFRSVNKSLRAINTKLSENISLVGKLVSESTRIADTLDQILAAISGLIDVEAQSIDDNQPPPSSGDGDINIDIPSMKNGGGGFNPFEIINTVDDVLDIGRHLRGGKKGLGNQNRLYRRARKKGMPSFSGGRMSGGRGKFGALKNLTAMGGIMPFAKGGMPSRPVKALVGEAGPELVLRSVAGPQGAPEGQTTKMAAGGIAPGGMLPTSGIGYGGIKGGEAMGFAQPLTDAMEVLMKISGAQILGTMGNFLRYVGPLAGAFVPMLSPFVSPLATIFGMNQSAAAAELTQGVPTENQAIKSLGKIFGNIFKVLGIFGGGGKDDTGEKDDDDDSPYSGEWGPLLDLIKSVEAGTHKYNAINYGSGPGFIEGLTEMTIREADAAAEAYHRKYPDSSGALGQYQFMTPIEQAKAAGLNPDTDKFSPANQDKMAVHIIENKRRGKDWKERKISDDEFMEGLAAEWRGLPANSGGQTYQDSAASRNAAGTTWEKFTQAIQKIKGKGAYRGMVKSFSSNFGKMEGMFEISGPDTGYRVPEDLTHGQKIIGHGVEWLMKFNRSFVILPVENRQYSITKDPKKTLTRWSELSRQANIQTDGVDWNPIEEYRTVETPMSVTDDMSNVFKMFSKPVEVKPQKEMPVATVTPIDFNAGTRPTGVAILNNTIIQQQQVPVYIPVPVPGPVQYVSANVYESARTMRFMEFVKKLS